jgi:5-methylcytosine-specific restriction endonuclease McrA
MITSEIERALWKRYGLARCPSDHARAVLVQAVTNSGRKTLAEQCPDCGAVAKAEGKLADHPGLPLMDVEAARRRENAIGDAAKLRNANIRQRFAMRKANEPERSAEWFAAYDAYLRTPEWQRRRNMVLDRDRHHCQAMFAGCQTAAREVHHASARAYAMHDAMGHAPLWELQAICTSCHQRLTEWERGGNRDRT